ncbi:MAG: hypothetical protein ACRD2T_02445 [Thermoanaerobaculia bacterium]
MSDAPRRDAAPGVNPLEVLSRSRALWNRERLDLASDEVLAQLLDRGSLEDWRALHRLLSDNTREALALRDRVERVAREAPIGLPHFWRAVLAGLGHPVDWASEPKGPPGAAAI